MFTHTEQMLPQKSLPFLERRIGNSYPQRRQYLPSLSTAPFWKLVSKAACRKRTGLRGAQPDGGVGAGSRRGTGAAGAAGRVRGAARGPGGPQPADRPRAPGARGSRWRAESTPTCCARGKPDFPGAREERTIALNTSRPRALVGPSSAGSGPLGHDT